MFVLSRQSPAGAKKTRFNLQWQANDERTAILHGVMTLKIEAGDALKACAECHKPFVARKRQIYCAPLCSQKVRDRKRPPRPSRAKV